MSDLPLLLVLSRWTWPISNGHDRCIDQFVRMAHENGYEVHVRAFSATPRSDPPEGLPVASASTIPMPGLKAAIAGIRSSRPATLQEILYSSNSARKELAAAAAAVGARVVVCDMLRLSGYAMDIGLWPEGCRRVLFMEDLLSRRYGEFPPAAGAPLGYLGAAAPAVVVRLASFLPKLAMAVESRLARRREVSAAAACDSTILVSETEAAMLRSWSPGSRVDLMRPAVFAAGRPVRDGARSATTFVFVGPGYYAPNAAALRLISAALSDLTSRGLAVPEVLWAGEARGMAPPTGVRALGRVPELGDVLGPRAVMLAPLARGTGISTKVLEAMAAGVPVIASPGALRGICEPGSGASIDCSEDPRSLADAIVRAAGDPGAADAAGEAGRRLVLSRFEPGLISRSVGAALGGGVAGRPSAM